MKEKKNVAEVSFNVGTHKLVPEHILLSEEEGLALLEKFNISKNQLPKILQSDPALQGKDPEVGDIIKILRNSPTVGKTEYFRVVIHG